MAKNTQTQAIGAALSAYFRGCGMTQVQVAERYDVSQSWIGRIYRGEFTPRADVAKRMCETAGVEFLKPGLEDHGGEAMRFRLLRLLDSVWEGTEEDATDLTAALLAIKRLRKGT